MKKLVCLLLTLVMMLTVMSACKPKEHVHTFDEAWQSDETDHWHQANCEHAEEIADKAPHEDLDDNDLCDVCGYAMNHAHTHSDKWSYNKDEHYHAPTCGCNANDKKYQKDNAPHVDKDNDAVCDVCGYDYDHTHVYNTDVWTKADETYHWHAPTCGHDIEGADKEEHKDEDNDGICDGCDWDYDHVHEFEETWTTDDDYHWYKATCGHNVFGQKNPHRDQDNDGKCDDCDITPEHFHDMDWEVWSGDETNHWHAAKGDCASCVDAEGNPIVADFGKHEEWKEDGVCDVCEYIVFHLYKVDVVLPEISTIVDAEGKPVLGEDGDPVIMPFSVKEGTTLEFYVSVPSTHRLESVTGAEVDMINYIKLDNEDGTTTYLYKITLAPEADTTITVVISKLSSVEEVASGDVVFDSVKNNVKLYYDIPFTPAETGRYVIVCMDRDDINFGPAGNVPTMQNSYEFEATAGQTVNLQAMYWPFNAKGQETFKYHILRVDEVFVLPYLEGQGFLLPAKVNTTFKFTLPEPGLYQFTTTLGNLVWVSDEDAAGTVLPQFFLCTYAGQEFTHTGKYTDSQSGVTYDFDWNIVKMNEAGALTVGNNSVSVDIEKYTGYTFTAPYTGYYTFEAGENVNLNILGTVKPSGIATMGYFGGSENFLTAGQTVRLYTSDNENSSNPATESFTGSLSITFDGYTPDVDAYGVTLHPGTSYDYKAEVSGMYTFQVEGDGNFVRVNGGAWAAKHDVSLEAGTTVKLEIRSDSNSSVRINISHGVFEHTVSLGYRNYQFHNNRTYTLYLTGGESPKPQQTYILNWTDVNLSITYNGTAITSGEEFAYTPGTKLTVVYNATATSHIGLQLVDLYEPIAPEMVLNAGQSGVALTGGAFGREMIFTALSKGSYVLSLAEGETNAKIVIGDTTYTAENLPVQLELEQGEELSMMIYSLNGVSDTINISMEKGTIDPDQPGQPGTPDPPDEPEIPNDELLYGKFYTDYDYYRVEFEGNTMYLTDRVNTNAHGSIEYEFTFVRNEDTVTLYDANGNVPTQFAIRRFPLGWGLVVEGEADPYILYEDKDDTKQTSKELVIGENAFAVSGNGIELEFIAPQDGTYIMSTASGENNAFIVYEPGGINSGYSELIIDGSGSHSVYLTEGQTVAYGVGSWDYSADTINLYFMRQEGYPHYHTYADAWESDADGHWHRANCAHTDKTTDKNAHKDENQDGDCDVCGRTYRTVYKVDFNLPEGTILQDYAGEPVDSLILNPVNGVYTLDCYLLIPNMYDVETIKILINGQELAMKADETAVDYWEVDDSEPGYWTVYIHYTNVDKDLTVSASAESPSRPAEVIEDNKEVTIDFTGKEVGENVYFKITFQAESDAYFYFSGHNGMLLSRTEEGMGMSNLLIDGITGEVITVYGVATYDGGDRSQTFSYSIHKCGSYNLPALSGAGLQLTAGVPTLITLMLPEDGLYHFTAGNYQWIMDNTIYNKQDFYYDASLRRNIYLFVDKVFAEDEEKTEEYILSWNIERIEETGALEVGANAVQPPIDGYSVYTFTAQIPGDYLFKLENGTMTSLHTYGHGKLDSETSSYFRYSLDFGETITIYVHGALERDEEGNVVENQKPISDTLTVVALSNSNRIRDDEQTIHFQTETVNSIISETNAMYKLTVDRGEISLDGINWVTSIDQLVLTAYEPQYLMVKSSIEDYLVAVEFERISLTADFAQGENTLTMVPGAEYEISILEMNKFALLWNADLDITVTTADGNTVANGENTAESKLYVIYNGEATADITFQVVDRDMVILPEPLVAGENTLTLRPGVEYQVTVDGMSLYALIWDASYDVTVTTADGTIANGAATTATALSIVYNGEAEAQITFQVADRAPVVVETQWVEGTNTLTLLPGKNYIVTLPAWEYAPGMFGYTFSWDNASVILYHGNLPTNDTAIGFGTQYPANVVSGMFRVSESQTLVLLNTSDTEVTVEVNLEKPMMVIGDNAVSDETYLWGDEALVFTAAETGFYTFTATDVIWVDDEEVAAGDSYSVIIAAGESVYISLDSGEDEVVITISNT